jgi:hypothetical protein
LINSSTTLLIGFLTIVVVLNLAATVCVTSSIVYSSSQKALQLLLVWLLPLLGAILVLSFWAHDRKTSSRSPVRDDQEPWLPGIGPESDRNHHAGGSGDSGSHEWHGGDGGST